MTLPPVAHQFASRLHDLTEATPYLVTETENGFDVSIDIVDAQWFGLFNKAGLTKQYIHHVSFPDDGTYSVTDDLREVEWTAGVPTAGAAQRVIGRVKEISFRKIWAFDEHGNFGLVADYSFDSEEGRALITAVADELGLTPRRGGAEKIGLVVGPIAAVGSVITVIVLIAMALAGKF